MLTLSVIAGTDALSCTANEVEALPALAVSVAVCVELTAETVAANAALVAFAGTITVAGTTTAELLLARFTLIPPLGAAAIQRNRAANRSRARHRRICAVETSVQRGRARAAQTRPSPRPLWKRCSRSSAFPQPRRAEVGSNCTCSVAV